MKYIGPFFRMNSLSIEEIKGQLFYLSKEAIKIISLNSKCGITLSNRNSKKSSSKNDINILNDFSPLVCVYKKASPIFIHNKTSRSFDESSFKKDILPATNAFMTLSLLELNKAYSKYTCENKTISSLKTLYKNLCESQLDFYCENLRNSEGFFVEKKNTSDNNSKTFNITDKNKKFNFSDQAFMMDAYYMYSVNYPKDDISKDYKSFSLEILQMFLDFKEALYNLSFTELCKILLALNIFFDISQNEDSKILLIDLTDFLINKFDEKDYFEDSIESCSLFYIILLDSFKHTDIKSFYEKAEEISTKLKDLYDDEKYIFINEINKKEIKYSSLEICFYFLAMLLSYKEKKSTIQDRNMISNLYKKYFINSPLVLSWPDAPTLDEMERYRGLSLKSKDMLNETFFRMPNSLSPTNTGIAPIFSKNITYSLKKNSFRSSKSSFDSSKNIYLFFMFIYYLKDDVISYLMPNFDEDDTSNEIEKSPKSEIEVEELPKLDISKEIEVK